MLISMQRPVPSLADLCCTELGKYYAKNIDEITPETAEEITTLEEWLAPKNRTVLAQSLIKHGQIPQATLHLCTVPANGKFNPDGSKLLIGHDNALHIYDALSGKLLTTLPNPPSSKELWLEKANWSPRGSYIFAVESPSYPYQQYAWHADTGNFLYAFGYEPCTAIKCTADEKNWIIKQNKKPWIIRDAQTGTVRAELEEPSGQYTIWAQDPTGQWIITNSSAMHWESIFYDAQTLQIIKTIPGKIRCFSGDGNCMAVENDNTLAIYNRAWNILQKLKISRMAFYATFNSDSSKIVSYNSNRDTVFDLKNGSQIDTVEHKILDTANNSFISKNLDATITLDYDEQKKATSILIEGNGIEKKSLTVPKEVRELYYTLDNDHYFLTKSDKVKHILNIKTGTTIPIRNNYKWSPFKREIISLMSSDGKFLTKSDDKRDRSIHVRQIINSEKIPLLPLFIAIAQKNKR